MKFILEDVIFLMPNWKWLALAAIFFGSLILRPLVRGLFVSLKKQLQKTVQKDSFGEQALRLPIEKPLSWILVSSASLTALNAIEITPKLETFFGYTLKIFLAIHTIRFFYILVDALGLMFQRVASRTTSTLDDQLVPFATKTLKVLVIALGFLIALQNFGFNVVGLLAGLGLGGLALALAAQDTAANVFGSVTILLDQPFAVGDYIKIGDTEGTVEEIGFRSTRIRTFYNSVITIPNSVMAKEKIDNMQSRPRRRVRQVIGLTYDTTPEKIEAFSSQVKSMLKGHPKVDQDVLVAFNSFNASSLDVLVQFHMLQVYDGFEENELIQKLFLQIMEIAKSLNVDFAFPTQTVYFKQPSETKPPLA